MFQENLENRKKTRNHPYSGIGLSNMLLCVCGCVYTLLSKKRYIEHTSLSCLSRECFYTASFLVTSIPSCVHARIHITSTCHIGCLDCTGASRRPNTYIFVHGLKYCL